MIKKLCILLFVSFFLINCGGGDQAKTEQAPAPAVNPDGVTEEQVKNGIGPIAAFTLEALDQELADKGNEVFGLKCIACHKLDERLVGPPLGGVTTRRSPSFIMNMILNPDEMVKKHPEVKAMLAEFYVPMTFQNVTQDDARAILEYLRTQ
ncbi:cytochrome c [bacterium]|nr:cytochrome c [bacterium]